MPTALELTLMKSRRDAGRSATKFFKDIKPVRSVNNPFAFPTEEEKNKLYDDLRPNSDGTILGSMDFAAEHGLGNCDEKARICFASLSCNPTLLINSGVSLVTSVNYDHVWIMVANRNVPKAPVDLSLFGLTAMIVDGWTEDVYFPNLSVWDAKINGLGNTPNPRQFYVREQIRKHLFCEYGSGGENGSQGGYGVPDNF